MLSQSGRSTAGKDRYVAVDRELEWADLRGPVDGLKAALRLRLHHYSSLSITHSYSVCEKNLDGNGQPIPYSIDNWKNTPIQAQDISDNNLPLSDGYFLDGQGHPVSRTWFDYIRDHLGYRLELQQASFPTRAKPGDTLRVAVTLINRGFSVIHNPRPVFLVLIGPDGRIIKFPVKDADPRTWQHSLPLYDTYDPLTHKFIYKDTPLIHPLSKNLRLPNNLTPGVYRLGLWLPDGSGNLRYQPRFAVRVANRDVPWWTNGRGRFGVNLLGTVTVVR